MQQQIRSCQPFVQEQKANHMHFCPVTTPFSKSEVQAILGLSESALSPLLECGVLRSSVYPNGRVLTEPLLFSFFDMFRSVLFLRLGWPFTSHESCEVVTELLLDAYDAQFMSVEDGSHPDVLGLQGYIEGAGDACGVPPTVIANSEYLSLASFEIYHDLNQRLSSFVKL
ncbi:MAG: hypothetical protein H5U17_13330 [Defluviimonas sp.]|nr:hypothetical protein [Defluviimonas sp.]